MSADLLIGTESPVKSNTVEVLERVESEGGHEVIMVLSQAQCSRYRASIQISKQIISCTQVPPRLHKGGCGNL